MIKKMSFQVVISCLTVLQCQAVFAQNAQQNPCQIPFTKMTDKNTGKPFKIEDAVNTRGQISDQDHRNYNYRNRFLVANLDTVENGQCKGLVESYPQVAQNNIPGDLFPELKNTQILQHFMEEVQPFYQTPANKRPIVNMRGKDYCIGQTISLCEIRGNNVVVEVARLGTSSLNANSAPNRSRTYGEYNEISHRSWMAGRNYTTRDGQRDEAMGGVDSTKMKGIRYTRYTSGGGMILNNFLKWDGLSGYEVPNFYGGLHELSVGETNVNNLGAPVSHGCMRLTQYGSILARWWTPLRAKLFVYYTDAGYRQTPPR